jgi:NDP-sugar pyrophosphorylase family protein
VAVLAGGLGTRLGSVAPGMPKSLVDVNGRPFAVHQLELLRRQGLTDIVFLVGHLGELIRDALGDGSTWGVQVRYVFDGPRLLGTGGAIQRALPDLGDPFFVLYGDSYLECDFAAVERAFLTSGASGLMTVYRNRDRYDRSNVVYESGPPEGGPHEGRPHNGRILRYDKEQRTPDMQHIDYGLGVFRKSAFDRAPDEAFDLVAVYQRLLAAGSLAGFEVNERFFEVGSPEGLEATRAHLAVRGTAGKGTADNGA